MALLATLLEDLPRFILSLQACSQGVFIFGYGESQTGSQNANDVAIFAFVLSGLALSYGLLSRYVTWSIQRYALHHFSSLTKNAGAGKILAIDMSSNNGGKKKKSRGGGLW